MRTYFVIQNIASFRIDWACLARPEVYRLVLITSGVHHARLQAAGQLRHFERVVRVPHFTTETVTAAIAGVMRALGVCDPTEVRIACHDEYALGIAAAARAALGVPGAGPEELRGFVSKLSMKAALADAGLRIPRHVAWDGRAYADDPAGALARLEAELGLPIFAKPIDESGSVGTARLADRAALAAWCEAHRDASGFELDEWLSGTLYHCDSVIQGGRVLHTQVSEYAHPCFDYLAGRICASITLPDDDPQVAPLRAFTAEVLAALWPIPADTVTHLEVFRTPADELVFLEIAARAPAALVPYTYARTLGWNIEEVHFRLQLGLLEGFAPRRGPYSAWAYFPHRPGVVTARHAPRLQSPSTMTWHVEVGDRLDTPASIRETALAVQLWNEDYAALRADFEALDRCEPFSLQRAA